MITLALKAIWFGLSSPYGDPRLNQRPSTVRALRRIRAASVGEARYHPYLVLLNFSPDDKEGAELVSWISDNTCGRFYLHKNQFGYTGEIFFEVEEDAMMFFLHFS